MDGLTGLFGGQGLGAVEEKGRVVLRESGLENVKREVLRAIDMAKGDGRVMLVIDGVDALMAFTGAEAGDVRDLVGDLREVRMVSSSDGMLLWLQGGDMADWCGVARTRRGACCRSRFPVGTSEDHAVRDRACSAGHGVGASGPVCDQFERIGHWGGEGCQRGYEDFEGWGGRRGRGRRMAISCWWGRRCKGI